MRVTGIIMECNPFHEGHDYLLKEARRITQADYIIVVMSGDYVQRGEPAVFDKYIRADQVLKAGADLVLELPLYMACGSAEYFARGGIFQLEKLGVVTDLCFGSETGDLDHLAQCARILSLAEDTEGPVSPFQENGCTVVVGMDTDQSAPECLIQIKNNRFSRVAEKPERRYRTRCHGKQIPHFLFTHEREASKPLFHTE